MPDHLPVDLSIASPSGQRQVLLKEGATLPQEARAMFATQRAGERELALRLYEGATGDGVLIGDVRASLPAGLPPNTWLGVFVRVGHDLQLRIEVRENLRRLRIDATLDTSEGESGHFA